MCGYTGLSKLMENKEQKERQTNGIGTVNII